jgi:Sec-independent protein translocase protein TatA
VILFGPWRLPKSGKRIGETVKEVEHAAGDMHLDEMICLLQTQVSRLNYHAKKRFIVPDQF